MIVAGAGGQARECLEILLENNSHASLCFFDNTSATVPDLFAGRYRVLRNAEEVAAWFQKTGDRSFMLGLGNPLYRLKMLQLFESWGGILQSCISRHAVIGQAQTEIGTGATVAPGAVVTSNVKIGKGVLLNVHASVSHDSTVGDFVEISPGARITGRCSVGSFTSIGTNACILPGVRVGENVVIGAGSVVNKDVADNSVVAGSPARLVRRQNPISAR